MLTRTRVHYKRVPAFEGFERKLFQSTISGMRVPVAPSLVSPQPDSRAWVPAGTGRGTVIVVTQAVDGRVV